MRKSRKQEAQYRHLEAWGRMLGSMDYYIRDQQSLAATEKAPLHAVFRKDDGKWVTIEDCRQETQAEIARILERLYPTTTNIVGQEIHPCAEGQGEPRSD